MQLVSHLNFDGQCAEAFRFYEKSLGGKIIAMSTIGETPIAGQMPAEWGERILHAQLQVGDAVLMGADSPPGQFEQPKGFSVSLQVDQPAQAERIFESLADGGSVTMPLQHTFWAARFGMVVDRFGIPWMINCQASEA